MTTRHRRLAGAVFGAVWLVACGSSGAGDAGDQGQDAVRRTGTTIMGAYVVRSVTIRTKGAVEGEFRPTDSERASLVGTCGPTMWANFGISFQPERWERIDMALMTKDPIATGQTGSIPLDWVDVTFLDASYDSHQYKGPATLELTRHDAAPDQRRMTGAIRVSGLAGDDAAEGTSIDAEIEFDLNFSCGITGG